MEALRHLLAAVKESEVEQIFRIKGCESWIETVKDELGLKNLILLKHTKREEFNKFLIRSKEPRLLEVFQLISDQNLEDTSEVTGETKQSAGTSSVRKTTNEDEHSLFIASQQNMDHKADVQGNIKLARDTTAREKTQEDKTTQKVSTQLLSKLANLVSPATMTRIAIDQMGLELETIESLKTECMGNVWEFKFKILTKWKNKNPTDTRQKLLKLLHEAAKEDGLVDMNKVDEILG